MPVETKAWRCKFKGCIKYLLSKRPIVEHERLCLHNPDRRACRTCGNRSIEEYQNFDESFVDHWYCIKNDKFLINSTNLNRNCSEMNLTYNCPDWKSKNGN